MDGNIIRDGKMPPLWHYGHEEHDVISAKTFGFWLYMLSDALLFAGLFAAYAVLDHAMNMAGGPVEAQVVHPIAATWQTLAVLSSVFAYSLATVALKRGSRAGLIAGMAVAIVLGAVFIGLELADFASLVHTGATPDTSGFLSAFFVLIASHGLHMAFGLLWMLVMLVQVLRFGLSTAVVAQLLNLRLFWQFQASVWVCVYVFVYLKGTI
ncbi:MAG TPA: cytochrome c oxidase subunit 3 [Acidocella sp.]|jgi:cytochrome o ubiquinol oxidase subunit 3|nr:cytochrome c oxidase subunit 3 [Acidocella sp.]